MTTYARMVQPGTGAKRIIVLLYLIHPDRDVAIREALGPAPMILARADDGDPGPTFWQEIAHAMNMAAMSSPTDGFRAAGYVLGGWSAGCSGTRRRLIESTDDEKFKSERRAIVVADGTHASLPPEAWQLDVWRPWVKRARGGEELDEENFARPGVSMPSFTFAASHTYQTYVEHLPGAQRYTSTVNVLRSLTGLALPRPGLASGPSEYHDGDLHIESYPSADIDGPAHIRQQTEALPRMLRQYIRPLVESAASAPTCS